MTQAQATPVLLFFLKVSERISFSLRRNALIHSTQIIQTSCPEGEIIAELRVLKMESFFHCGGLISQSKSLSKDRILLTTIPDLYLNSPLIKPFNPCPDLLLAE